jgi:hypothetical protein
MLWDKGLERHLSQYFRGLLFSSALFPSVSSFRLFRFRLLIDICLM